MIISSIIAKCSHSNIPLASTFQHVPATFKVEMLPIIYSNRTIKRSHENNDAGWWSTLVVNYFRKFKFSDDAWCLSLVNHIFRPVPDKIYNSTAKKKGPTHLAKSFHPISVDCTNCNNALCFRVSLRLVSSLNHLLGWCHQVGFPLETSATPLSSRTIIISSPLEVQEVKTFQTCQETKGM